MSSSFIIFICKIFRIGLKLSCLFKNTINSLLLSTIICSQLFLRWRGWQHAIDLSAAVEIVLIRSANLIVDFNLIQIIGISIRIHDVVILVRVVVLLAGNTFIVQRPNLVANSAALAPKVNVRAHVIILQLVRIFQEGSSFGLALAQRYLGPQLRWRHIVIINFVSRNQGAVLLWVQCIELVVFIVWLSSHVHWSRVCLLKILLLLWNLLLQQGCRLTGSVETLHVPALSRHTPEIRLLTALFG